jgi:hypothetical protein
MRRARTFETEAAASDVFCRAHWVDVQMAIVPDSLAAFARDNAAALHAVAAGWQTMPPPAPSAPRRTYQLERHGGSPTGTTFRQAAEQPPPCGR